VRIPTLGPLAIFLLVAGLLAGCGEATSDPKIDTTGAIGKPGAARSARPARPLPPLDNLPVFYDLPLDVDAAYAAIPHRRTVFDFDHSNLPASDAAYLQRAFHLIDQGVRARVVGYRDLYSQGVSDSGPVERMEELIDALESIDPPTDLADYHSALIEALVAQRTVFEDWTDRGQDVPDHRQVARNANVREASRHLRHAYDLLMRAYGRDESDHNKAAFFDYHCALDFI